MAFATDYERLSSPPDHNRHPLGSCLLARPAEIGESADLVDLHRLRTPADLTTVRQESGNQLRVVNRLGNQLAFCEGLYTVGENRVLLPPKRNTTVPRDQWLVTLAARHADLEASARPKRLAAGGAAPPTRTSAVGGRSLPKLAIARARLSRARVWNRRHCRRRACWMPPTCPE